MQGFHFASCKSNFVVFNRVVIQFEKKSARLNENNEKQSNKTNDICFCENWTFANLLCGKGLYGMQICKFVFATATWQCLYRERECCFCFLHYFTRFGRSIQASVLSSKRRHIFVGIFVPTSFSSVPTRYQQ